MEDGAGLPPVHSKNNRFERDPVESNGVLRGLFREELAIADDNLPTSKTGHAGWIRGSVA